MKKLGCWVDDCKGEGCVFDGVDGMDMFDCSVAIKLDGEGKGRDDCPYWKEDEVEEECEHTCPNCGHSF